MRQWTTVPIGLGRNMDDEMTLSQTLRLLTDTIKEGKGRVHVEFVPSFLYQICNVLEYYELQEARDGEQA